MTLTQISGIDAMAAHQIGNRHFDGESVDTGGDSEYLISRVIARLAIYSPFHESVGVPGGHGTVPVRTVCSVGCPTLSCIGIVSGCPWSTRRF